MRNTLALAALATTLGAHSRVLTDDAGVIRAERAASNRAIAAHDTAGFGRILAPEFHETVSTNVQTSGRDEAVQYFGKLFADRPDVVYVRTPDRITVNAQWGQAAESGHWTGRWSSAEGITKNGGEYFAKWRKANDRWMLLSEIFVQTTCSGTRYCIAPPGSAKDSAARKAKPTSSR